MTIVNCDARHIPLADGVVQVCVTSPPYYGLRDYNEEGQIGLERTPGEYVANIVAVMREVRRVLRKDGTLWLVIGDSYAGSNKGTGANAGAKQRTSRSWAIDKGKRTLPRWGGGDTAVRGLAAKNLIGIPWRVAFALQDDGWWLRSDIIWYKPNPMTESAKDRPGKTHEYIFLLSKSRKYYYDNIAVLEPAKYDGRKKTRFDGSEKYANGYAPTDKHNTSHLRGHERWAQTKDGKPARNKRTVWTVATARFKGAHFATYPPALIEPCILAGSRRGDLVMDPFCGAGTTGVVAAKHGRRFFGVELNAEYIGMAEDRIAKVQPVLEMTP